MAKAVVTPTAEHGPSELTPDAAEPDAATGGEGTAAAAVDPSTRPAEEEVDRAEEAPAQQGRHRRKPAARPRKRGEKKKYKIDDLVDPFGR